MLLRDDRLQMYYNGQLSGNYRPHVPRAEFAKKALFVSGGKIAREDIDFVNSFCKESHDGNEDFYKAITEDILEKVGGGAVIRLIAELEIVKGTFPLSALFHDAEYGFAWHMDLNRYSEYKPEWGKNNIKKWKEFSQGLTKAFLELGISEKEFCSISGEEPSREGYENTVYLHIINDSSYGTKTRKIGNNPDETVTNGICRAFSEILELIRTKKSTAVQSKIEKSTIGEDFLKTMSGENITETYMKLASYGDKPELMGNDSVFCTALLRDLSARKSLTTVLSACLGEDIGNTVLNDAISKIISEKKGVVTVGVNLLLGKSFETILKEYSQELSGKINEGTGDTLSGLAELKKELVPGFTDNDAMTDSIVAKVLSDDESLRKAMLFFAEKFLLRK